MLDNIIYSTLLLVLPTALYNRGTGYELPTLLKLPDSILTLESIPIFRGAEKPVNSIEDPQAELYKNMPLWYYPGMFN